MSYQVPDDPLKYVNWFHMGDGSCAQLPQKLLHGSMPLCQHWKRGDQVKGKMLPRGTVIALFNSNGDYLGTRNFAKKHDVRGIAHTALYVGQDANGIDVVYQWTAGKRIVRRTYAFGGPTYEHNGDNYYVVEPKKDHSFKEAVPTK
jgi:hypothetical protein